MNYVFFYLNMIRNVFINFFQDGIWVVGLTEVTHEEKIQGQDGRIHKNLTHKVYLEKSLRGEGS